MSKELSLRPFNAFIRYLGEYTTFVFVYASTSFGTKIEQGSAIGWVIVSRLFSALTRFNLASILS